MGQIASPHGVRGLLKVTPFTEVPENLFDYGLLFDESGRIHYRLIRKGMHKGKILVEIEGVDDRDAADALKGQKLYLPRTALPDIDDDDSYYYADLIGLNAFLADDTLFGQIVSVHDFGAGDLLEIKRAETGKTIFYPFTLAAVPAVDVKAGRVTVEPPEGLLDDPDPAELTALQADEETP